MVARKSKSVNWVTVTQRVGVAHTPVAKSWAPEEAIEIFYVRKLLRLKAEVDNIDFLRRAR